MTEQRCAETVGDPPGYWTWHECGRPAKWIVEPVDDEQRIISKRRLVCGTHKNRWVRSGWLARKIGAFGE